MLIYNYHQHGCVSALQSDNLSLNKLLVASLRAGFAHCYDITQCLYKACAYGRTNVECFRCHMISNDLLGVNNVWQVRPVGQVFK